MQMVAKTLQGLEEVLAAEIGELGATDVVAGRRAVTFSGDALLLYRANRELFTASRILVPIHRFPADNEASLYQGVQQVNWRRFMDLKTTLAVTADVASRHFNHSHYLALKTKDAIVDQFRALTGRRPSVDAHDPDLRIHLHVRQDACTLLLDSSGRPLYQRGYRSEPTEASLNEVLAAGLVRLAGWDGGTVLMDPMCGAGTILIEAALMATGTAPQHRRRDFAFMRWKDFDPAAWQQALGQPRRQMANPPGPIIGSDIAASAIKACRRNILNAGMQDYIHIEIKSLEHCKVPPVPATLIMNPPYGERMAIAEAGQFYAMIGTQLKHRFAGATAFVLGRRGEALKAIGLRPTRKWVLFNGPLECLYQRFDLFAGSGRRPKRPLEDGTADDRKASAKQQIRNVKTPQIA